MGGSKLDHKFFVILFTAVKSWLFICYRKMGKIFIGETLEIGLDVALKTMNILIDIQLLLLADGNGGLISV